MQDIIAIMNQRNFDKAALRGEPSYVWRDGQQRRLDMITRVAGDRIKGQSLDWNMTLSVPPKRLSNPRTFSTPQGNNSRFLLRLLT